ncbi:hypothetical protein ARMSODRAFT_725815 [Armillaria solidipes]|uniref:Uncharacterized protein n=1 Tax=Armillaria solidipes TaxID=1076256 RepID=A0A2H3BC00_9AGAR|nr:hypothetical protein ARMSODRAFT_725815 [Armillaria solidipes]
MTSILRPCARCWRIENSSNCFPWSRIEGHYPLAVPPRCASQEMSSCAYSQLCCEPLFLNNASSILSAHSRALPLVTVINPPTRIGTIPVREAGFRCTLSLGLPCPTSAGSYRSFPRLRSAARMMHFTGGLWRRILRTGGSNINSIIVVT